MHELEDVILAEARTEISYADSKASILLAALGIGFGAFLGGLLVTEWTPTDLRSWGEAAWWGGGAAALLSVVFAGLAVWPRITDSPPGSPVYYWGDVAQFATLDELEDHIRRTPVTHAQRTRHQMWHISHIVRRKYSRIRAALIFAGIAVVLLLASGASVLLEE